MSAAHTPAPWTVKEAFGSDDKLCFHEICGPDGATIASTWAGPNEADAHLMASAPSLLAALKRMLDAYHEDPFEADTAGAVELAYDAIAKATGEQQ